MKKLSAQAVFNSISNAVSRIQSGESQPQSVLREKGGSGHVTVRIEDPSSNTPTGQTTPVHTAPSQQAAAYNFR